MNEKEWKSFLISDIFDIFPGKRLVAADTTAGNRPFIGALDNNNGVARFVSDTNKSLDKNVLGVNYNGKWLLAFIILMNVFSPMMLNAFT